LETNENYFKDLVNYDVKLQSLYGEAVWAMFGAEVS